MTSITARVRISTRLCVPKTLFELMPRWNRLSGSEATQEPVAAENAEGKDDLAGGRSRKKLTERDQIDVGGLVEPLAPHHQVRP